MTTITNLQPYVHSTMDEVQTFMTNNGISISGSISLVLDQLGYVEELITDATFTGPQITLFEDEFFHKRTHGDKGDDVASAATITLTEGTLFDITGVTAIDFISTVTWKKGSIIHLQFDSGITINHDTVTPPVNTEAIFLDGSANAVMTAGSTLTLIFDDVYWRELGRMTA